MKINILAFTAIACLTFTPACAKTETDSAADAAAQVEQGATEMVQVENTQSETGTRQMSAADLPASIPKPLPPKSAPAPMEQITYIDARRSYALISSDQSPIILDVRTPREFKSGHIDGAINIDFRAADFGSQLQALDKSQDYIIHCRSGGRSNSSIPFFKKLGFQHVYHMDGGMNAWNKAGLPTVK